VGKLTSINGLTVVVTPAWSQGRYLALETALKSEADHIHYVDFDRLLRWIETRLDEWRRTVDAVEQSDCLVIGRTEAAWATHPQALRQTEAISNTVFSHLLGKNVDLSAGSKGFSRAVVEILVANTQADRAMGADSEWVVIAHRAGFQVDTIRVDGLDWETADRHQERAATKDQQYAAALRYDENAQNWAMRVAVAKEIVESGLVAFQRPLEEEVN
jgi:hypothetical protein